MQSDLLPFSQLQTGLVFEHEYAITPACHEAFVQTFKDKHPLHTDEHYAREQGFAGCVMHGGILAGFISHFVGEVLPWRGVTLLTSEYRFHKPCYLGDTLQLEAKVEHLQEGPPSVAVLNYKFHCAARSTVVARGKIQVAVSS